MTNDTGTDPNQTHADPAVQALIHDGWLGIWDYPTRVDDLVNAVALVRRTDLRAAGQLVRTEQRTDRSGAEQAALDAWERGSGDTMGMLYAVRDALAHQDRTEDARLAIAERKAADLTEVIAQIRDLAYRAGTGPESMRDALTAIHERASRAVARG